MAINNDSVKNILDSLDVIQKQLDEIKDKLIIETHENKNERSLIEDDDHRTLIEWGKEGLGFHLDTEKDWFIVKKRIANRSYPFYIVYINFIYFI